MTFTNQGSQELVTGTFINLHTKSVENQRFDPQERWYYAISTISIHIEIFRNALVYTQLVHVPGHVTQVAAGLRLIKELYVNTRRLSLLANGVIRIG